jgi:F0F1-type ATP synthase assembly protein I
MNHGNSHRLQSRNVQNVAVGIQIVAPAVHDVSLGTKSPPFSATAPLIGALITLFPGIFTIFFAGLRFRLLS